MSGFLALVTAALEGLASLKFFWVELKALNLAARLDAIEARQQEMQKAFKSLETAKTPEEIQNAAKSASLSWNS